MIDTLEFGYSFDMFTWGLFIFVASYLDNNGYMLSYI